MISRDAEGEVERAGAPRRRLGALALLVLGSLSVAACDAPPPMIQPESAAVVESRI